MGEPPPLLAIAASKYRGGGRACLYARWRILVTYLFGPFLANIREPLHQNPTNTNRLRPPAAMAPRLFLERYKMLEVS
jgi:hypothetical protein